MTKPDVILEVLRQMAIDATDATHLIDRAYAAGLREGERTASLNITEGLAVARDELSLSSLSKRVDSITARIDTLADTTNENLAIIAEALGNVLIDPDEGLSEQEAVEFLCQLHDDGELPAFVERCRKQRSHEVIDLDGYNASELAALLGV